MDCRRPTIDISVGLHLALDASLEKIYLHRFALEVRVFFAYDSWQTHFVVEVIALAWWK